VSDDRELGLRRDDATDYDPAALDARAVRLERAAAQLDGVLARDLDVRRVVVDLRTTAALLRRLADDLRLLERFLRDVQLLAPDDPPAAEGATRSAG